MCVYKLGSLHILYKGLYYCIEGVETYTGIDTIDKDNSLIYFFLMHKTFMWNNSSIICALDVKRDKFITYLSSNFRNTLCREVDGVAMNESKFKRIIFMGV